MLGTRTRLSWAYSSPRESGNATFYPTIFLCLQRIQRRKPRAETCVLWKTNTKTQDKWVLVMVTKSMINS